jgi:hypothetical protein
MRKPSDRTEAALEAVYSAFTQSGLPQPIVVCPCCVSEAELKVMTGTKLRDLTWAQLEHYLSAVFLTSGAPKDFRYFLPRLLDLNAHVKWDFESDWEILLGKLALGEWQTWPARERETLMEFLRAYCEDLIAAQNADGSEIDSLLCGLARGGIDLTEFLKRLAQPDAEAAFFALHDQNAVSLMKGKLANSFWKDHRPAGEPIRHWLLSEESAARLKRRWSM